MNIAAELKALDKLLLEAQAHAKRIQKEIENQEIEDNKRYSLKDDLQVVIDDLDEAREYVDA